MSKLLAVGTVAFDAIETPFGKTDKILGGSATFVGLAASHFGIKTGVRRNKQIIHLADTAEETIKYFKSLLVIP